MKNKRYATINRDTALQRKAYSDRLVIDSTEFNNVAYEVRGGTVLVMMWLEQKEYIQFPARFDELRRLANEMLDICDGWQGVRT